MSPRQFAPQAKIWSLVGIIFFGGFVRAEDWPGWMGPRGDGTWNETGLVETIPSEGLKIKWRVPVGFGYSGPAVAGSRVFLSDFQKETGESTNDFNARAQIKGKERLLCFDSQTGRLLWQYAYPEEYKISYSAGPRATPTIEGDKVYHLGAEGHLACLETLTGKLVWKTDLKKDLGSTTPLWGFCSHPLVHSGNVYLMGGPSDGALLCLDQATGKLKWKALPTKEPGYAPVVLHQGKMGPELLAYHPEGVASVSPKTGAVNWQVPLTPQYAMSIAGPRVAGEVVFASGIGDTGVALEMGQGESGKPQVKELWRQTNKTGVPSANTTPIIVKGVIYGSDCQTGAFRAVDLRTGNRLWESFLPTTGNRRGAHGTAFIVRAGDLFYLFSETGHLVLMKPNPEEYVELGRFKVLEPTNESFGRPVVWSHPAFAQKAMFARNDKELVRVELAK